MNLYLKFWKTRVRGIWLLLTKKYVVAIGSNNEGDLRCYYNVTHESWRLMIRVLDPAYEEAEGQKQALRDAKNILNQ